MRWRDSHGVSSGIRRLEIVCKSRAGKMRGLRELRNKVAAHLGMCFYAGRRYTDHVRSRMKGKPREAIEKARKRKTLECEGGVEASQKIENKTSLYPTST
jgi:hypothetical protein